MKTTESLKEFNIRFSYTEEGKTSTMTLPSAISSQDLLEEFFNFMHSIGYTNETINDTIKDIASDLNFPKSVNCCDDNIRSISDF